MPDGTIYAGISPVANKPMYLAAEDAPIAMYFNEAAKYNQAQEHEKAAHNAYLAHGYSQHALHHDAEAAKVNTEQHGHTTARTAEKNSAA